MKERPILTWQPIESAPKDGTLVDLWANGERLPDCRWEEHDPSLGGLTGWWQKYAEAGSFAWLGRGIRDRDFNPTHWMRPPAGP